MDQSVALKLRELIGKHSAAMVDELSGHMDSELQAARNEAATQAANEVAAEVAAQAAEAMEEAIGQERLHAETEILKARLSTAESLNQCLRRIRQTHSEEDALSILPEGTALFAQRAVVLQVENNQAVLLGARGIEKRELSFPVQSAAAIASVRESRDPAVALVSASELSRELAEALAAPDQPSLKAYLFPVVARHEVVALLIACGDPVSAAAIELLSEAAGMKIEALEPPALPVVELKPLPSPELVQISSPSRPQKDGGAHSAWSALSAHDQKVHLQAQRVARVKVAEMRLYHGEQLRKGVAESNIYGELGNEIDRARADFLHAFLSKSTTMVDYLHLELLRSLAHDDDRLLGQDYPGPMV